MLDWFFYNRSYCRLTALALAIVALAGVAMNAVVDPVQAGLACPGPKLTCTGDAADDAILAFDWGHNVIHVILAAAAAVAGYLASGRYARPYALTAGFAYLALGGAGFWNADILSFGYAHLEIGENVFHLLIGAYGIAVATLGRKALAPERAMAGPEIPDLR